MYLEIDFKVTHVVGKKQLDVHLYTLPVQGPLFCNMFLYKTSRLEPKSKFGLRESKHIFT